MSAAADSRSDANRSSERVRSVLTSVAVSVLSLVCLELAVRIHFAVNGESPPHVDESLHREWSWAKGHLDVGRPPEQGPFLFDDRLGWVPRPEPERGINSAGMRARREFSEKRLSGVRRIALVGDSLTMGATVSDAEAFHAVLGDEFLTGWEVLNLGVSGYGVDQAILMWEIRAARYRPDIVVLGFYHRDYLRTFSRFRSYRKPYFSLGPQGSLELHDNHLLPPEALYSQYASGLLHVGGWSHAYALSGIRRIWSSWNRATGVDRVDPDWRLMAALLRRFRDGALERGVVPYVLVIPERPGRRRSAFFADIDRLVIEESQSLGMRVHSLADSFYAVPDAERAQPWFRADGHFTEIGNCEMARALAADLRAADLVDELAREPADFDCRG